MGCCPTGLYSYAGSFSPQSAQKSQENFHYDMQLFVFFMFFVVSSRGWPHRTDNRIELNQLTSNRNYA